MEIRYPATVEPQPDGTFLVQFVDMADTFTEGHTLDEAIFNAAEVLSGMLAWRIDEGKDVPASNQNIEGAHYIAPAAKRIEDLTHWPALKTSDRAAVAPGKP